MTSSKYQLSDRYSAKWDGQQLIAYRHYRNTERPLCYLNITALLKVASDSLCRWLDSKSNLKGNFPAPIPDRFTAVSGGKSSQCERLLKHFKKGRSVTRLESFHVLGICELSSRIGELKAKGHPNRFGETVKVKKYYFGREQ